MFGIDAETALVLMHHHHDVVIIITLAAGTCADHDVDHYHLNCMLLLITQLSKLPSKHAV